MNDNGSLNRRQFIILLFAATGATLAVGSYFSLFRRLENKVIQLGYLPENKKFFKLILEIGDSMELIGNKYLNLISDNINSENHLIDIVNEVEALEFSEYSYSKIKNQIKERILLDFENNRTIHVDNWMLTETEVKFCVWVYHNKV